MTVIVAGLVLIFIVKDSHKIKLTNSKKPKNKSGTRPFFCRRDFELKFCTNIKFYAIRTNDVACFEMLDFKDLSSFIENKLFQTNKKILALPLQTRRNQEVAYYITRNASLFKWNFSQISVSPSKVWSICEAGRICLDDHCRIWSLLSQYTKSDIFFLNHVRCRLCAQLSDIISVKNAYRYL